MALELTPKRILIVRFSSLGDILLTTPLVRALKQRFPGCQLDYLTGSRYQELLTANPHIDGIISLHSGTGIAETRKTAARLADRNYDVLIDVHGSVRSLLFRWGSRIPVVLTFKKLRFQRSVLILLKRSIYPDDRSMALRMLDTAASLGIRDDGGGLDFFVNEDVKQEALRLIAAERPPGQGGLIGLAPGARHNTKRWLIDRWRQLAKMLVEKHDATIVVLGGDNDRGIGNQVSDGLGIRARNCAGQLTLAGSAAVLSHCRAVITNDTGVLHMAAARQVPVVAIFGPTVRAFGFYPFRVPYRIVERSLYCRPCTTKGSPRCPLGHFRCMKEIASANVLSAFEDLMSSLPKSE